MTDVHVYMYNVAAPNSLMYSGTLLFQPHLGQTKVAGLVRWLDLLHVLSPYPDNNYTVVC